MTNIVKTMPLEDGFAVETVHYGSGTLCISTQAGCAMACPFCASGKKGLYRNLTPAEMSAQVALHKDVKRITLSGIGEPLDNLENVKSFISQSELPVSVTTSVPDAEKLRELIDTPHNGVMLSVHSGLEETHRKLIPKSCSLDSIFGVLEEIFTEISNSAKRKIGFNYLLFKGVNDTPEEIDAFIERVVCFKGATVHLLQCNHVENSRYESPDGSVTDSIYEKMRQAGLNVRRANRWRKEAEGGCGTLFLKSLQK